MRNKLTEADVREIRANFVKRGVRLSNAGDLAPKYGVLPQTVLNAALGRTWSHLK